MSKTEPAAATPAPQPAASAGVGVSANSAETEASSPPAAGAAPAKLAEMPRPKEIGGPKGPEPTRYGDWERDGRCVDF